MDNSNRNLTRAELEPIEALLQAEKAVASPLELDRIKLQAIRQAERSRPRLYARTKGTLMKSRLALTLLLVAGFMFSTTGATLAISGSSGSGNAATGQYVSPGGAGPTYQVEYGVAGTKAKGGEKAAVETPNNTLRPSPTETTKGKKAVEGAQESGSTPAPTVEQVAVVSSDNSLPFTGFLAIPLLAIGVGLILLGGVIAVKSRREPAVRH
jgi:hypothetical protein